MTSPPPLRPHQEHAGHLLRHAFSRGLSRVILYGATGSGKTIMAIRLIQRALAQGVAVDFLVNRCQLCDQTSDVFRSFGLPHGILQGASSFEPEQPLCLASIDTLSRRTHRKPGLIIVDECHWSAEKPLYRTLFQGCKVVGLTASPYHPGLGRWVEELGGPLYEEILVPAGSRIAQLQGAGFLVHAQWMAYKSPDLAGVKTSRKGGVLDYDSDQQAKKFGEFELVGDVIERWMNRLNDRKTMVFNCNIQHSQSITDQFLRLGVASAHVDCYMSPTDKKNIYQRFKSGEIQVLNNCVLVGEGSDFPDCSAIILNRSTKSPTRLDQWIGRGLRIAAGKENLVIHDHGKNYELGAPWDREVGRLDDGTKKAFAHPGKLITCPRCGLVRKSGSRYTPCEHCGLEEERPVFSCQKCGEKKLLRWAVCEACGYEPIRPGGVRYRDGEEELVLDSKRPLSGRVKLAMGDPESVWGQILSLGRKREKKPSWCQSIFCEVFGFMPRYGPVEEIDPSEDLIKFVTARNIRFAKSPKRRWSA